MAELTLSETEQKPPPDLLGFDPRNVILTHTVSLSDGALSAIGVKYFNDLSGRQPLRVGGPKLGVPLAIPALFLAVAGIIRVRSEKEMVGINTCGRVAPMTDQKAVGDRAALRFPGQAIGSAQFLAMVNHRISPATRRSPTENAPRQGLRNRIGLKLLTGRQVTPREKFCRNRISHLLAPLQRHVVRGWNRVASAVPARCFYHTRQSRSSNGGVVATRVPSIGGLYRLAMREGP